MKSANKVVKALQDLYSKDPAAGKVFDNLAGRERNPWQSTVDLMSRQTGLSRGEVVRVFRAFEQLDLGVFKVGRRGGQSRFEWSVSPLSAGRAAAQEGTEITGVTAEEKAAQDASASELVEHNFHLRTDLPVRFSLPSDLSHTEARRLADFLRTLPLGTGPEA